VSVEMSGKNLTGNAGLVPVGKFATKLGLTSLFEEHISIERGANAVYSVADALLITLLSVVAGGSHVSHVSLLRNDGLLRTIFEWARFPVNTTLGRIFRLFSPKHCVELAEVDQQARRKVWGRTWFQRITLEFDSSVKGVFGHQEGAEKGFNPKKKGQRSYHPLLCFVAETRECLHNWFRCGNAYSANGSAEFMRECLARLPKRFGRLFGRGDSAFFDGKLLDVLDAHHMLYAIKAAFKGMSSLLANNRGSLSKTVRDGRRVSLSIAVAGGLMRVASSRCVVPSRPWSIWGCLPGPQWTTRSSVMSPPLTGNPGIFTATMASVAHLRIGFNGAKDRWGQPACSRRTFGPIQRCFKCVCWRTIFWSGCCG